MPQVPTNSSDGNAAWPSLDYSQWSKTCDTLHAHTQLLGKLASALAPREPQLQHSALRLTARGWETLPLPVADRAGDVVLGLDLRDHEAFIESSSGLRKRIPLAPNRSVGSVTNAILEEVRGLGIEVPVDLTPQEVWWTVPLDQDDEHATYDTKAVETYFTCATRAALVLATFRAPYRGRSTPVNAWWGSFDLAVSLFSGSEAEPPSNDFIMRNAMDAQEVAVGWWPGDPRYGRAAFYAYAHPATAGFGGGNALVAPSRWEDSLGEYVLDQDDLSRHPDPDHLALEFVRSAFRHACLTCRWDPALLASAEGNPPPVH
jgi:Family of unknown function (DUF5996)